MIRSTGCRSMPLVVNCSSKAMRVCSFCVQLLAFHEAASRRLTHRYVVRLCASTEQLFSIAAPMLAAGLVPTFAGGSSRQGFRPGESATYGRAPVRAKRSRSAKGRSGTIIAHQSGVESTSRPLVHLPATKPYELVSNP